MGDDEEELPRVAGVPVPEDDDEEVVGRDSAERLSFSELEMLGDEDDAEEAPVAGVALPAAADETAAPVAGVALPEDDEGDPGEDDDGEDAAAPDPGVLAETTDSGFTRLTPVLEEDADLLELEEVANAPPPLPPVPRRAQRPPPAPLPVRRPKASAPPPPKEERPAPDVPPRSSGIDFEKILHMEHPAPSDPGADPEEDFISIEAPRPPGKAEAEAEASGGGRWLVALVLLGAAGAGGWWWTTQQSAAAEPDPMQLEPVHVAVAPAHGQSDAERPAEGPVAAESVQVEPEPETSPTEPQPEDPSPEAEPETPAEATAPERAEPERPERRPEPARPREPRAERAEPRPEPEPETTPPQPARPEPERPEPRPEPQPEDLPPTPTREQVQAALAAVRPAVQACIEGHGTVRVRIIVRGASGRVTTAVVQDGYFARQPYGGCIARAVRTARFPRFQQSTFVIVYPFQL